VFVDGFTGDVRVDDLPTAVKFLDHRGHDGVPKDVDHVQAALAEWPDRDLAAARRVFSALVTAMSRFEDELQQS
jgi:hypothetical protein